MIPFFWVPRAWVLAEQSRCCRSTSMCTHFLDYQYRRRNKRVFLSWEAF